MKSKTTICAVLSALVVSFLMCTPASAFWVWTPETNKWVNPKYAVKETPKEQLEHALSFYNNGDMPEAIKEFQKLIKHYPKAREAADAQFYLAESLEKDGQIIKAFNSYQMVIEKYPFSEKSGEVVERQYRIGEMMLEGKDKRNKFIKVVIGADYDPIEIFRTVIKNAPYGPYASSAQYKIGLYLSGKEMYQDARDEFEKTINDYPESEWAKAAQYQIALSDAKRSSDAQYDQRVTEAAIEELNDFVEDFPDAELTADAQGQIRDLKEKEAENNFLIAQFYEKNKKYKAAKIYYSTIADKYKNTTWAKQALQRIRVLNEIQ